MVRSIVIHADGACSGNPGPGGWAATVREGNASADLLIGGSRHTTNNAMELRAAASGLAHASRLPGVEGAKVTLRLDSEYVLKGLSQWLPGWKRKGWRTASGGAVKNRDLWQEIDVIYQELCLKAEVSLHYVRGHSGDPDNEFVDEEAVKARDASRAAEGDWTETYHGDPPAPSPLGISEHELTEAGYELLKGQNLFQKKVHEGSDVLYFINIEYHSLNKSSRGQISGTLGEVKAQFHTEDNLKGEAVNISFFLTSIAEAEAHIHAIWSRMGYGRYASSMLEPS